MWVCLYIQGGPERMQHFRSIISRKGGQNEKVVCNYCVYNSFSSKITPRLLMLMKAFWFYGRFSEACNVIFKICSSISKVTIYVPKIFYFPRVKFLLLLCKAKPAWIKRSIHYVALPHYTPRELLKDIPPYLRCDFWYKRCTFWKWHCLRKMALESKHLHQN